MPMIPFDPDSLTTTRSRRGVINYLVYSVYLSGSQTFGVGRWHVPDSITQFGRRTWRRTNLVLQPAANRLIVELLRRRAYRRLDLTGPTLTIDHGPRAFEAIMGLDYGDELTVALTPLDHRPGVLVRSMRHRCAPRGPGSVEWSVELGLHAPPDTVPTPSNLNPGINSPATVNPSNGSTAVLDPDLFRRIG